MGGGGVLDLLPLCRPEWAVCVAPRSRQEDAGQDSDARLSRPRTGASGQCGGWWQWPDSVPCQAWAAHPGGLAGVDAEPGAAQIQSLPTEQSPAHSSRWLGQLQSLRRQGSLGIRLRAAGKTPPWVKFAKTSLQRGPFKAPRCQTWLEAV